MPMLKISQGGNTMQMEFAHNDWIGFQQFFSNMGPKFTGSRFGALRCMPQTRCPGTLGTSKIAHKRIAGGGLRRLFSSLTVVLFLQNQVKSFRVEGGYIKMTTPPATAAEQHKRQNAAHPSQGLAWSLRLII
jgi:hypothetical protein